MDYLLRTESYYLRSKQALLIQADLSDFLVEYYLSLKQNNVALSREHDEQLKQLLAGLALHLTGRPPDETVAWTLLMRGEQPYSLFVTGSTLEQAIVGQVLYEQIRHTDVNVFNQQTSRAGFPPTQSAVRCESSDIAEMIETFYRQSEQLPIKVYFKPDSDKALALVAMPEFDAAWFEQSSPQSVADNLESYDRKLVKTCGFRFSCSCSLEKLLPFFKSIPAEQLTELYGEDKVLLVNCPRCGKTFEVDRKQVTQS